MSASFQFAYGRVAVRLLPLLLSSLIVACSGSSTPTSVDYSSLPEQSPVLDDANDDGTPDTPDLSVVPPSTDSPAQDGSGNNPDTGEPPDNPTADDALRWSTQADFEDVDPSRLPLNLAPLPAIESRPVDADASNHAPYFDNLTDRIIYAGDELRLVIAPRDPDGQVPGQFIDQIPEGATYTDNLDGTRTLRWRPLQPDVGVVVLTATAVDPVHPLLRTQQTIRLQVILPPDPSTIVNLGPTLDSIEDSVIRAGDTLVLKIKAVDPNGTFGPVLALNQPAGSTFDTDTEEPEFTLLRWPTSINDLGIHQLSFRALDAIDSSLTFDNTVTVRIADPAEFERPGFRLRELADARNFRIGYASVLEWYERPDADLYSATAAQEFNLVSTENSMKWGYINPRRDQYQWEAADRLVAFARQHDIQIHGHPLIWHRQLPGWVQRLPLAERRPAMLSFIRTVMNRYNNDVALWDVVNEALDEDGTFRSSVWHDAMGERFIDAAFRQANIYGPQAALLYNDYDVAWEGLKSDGMYRLMQRLLAEEVPVDGVGFQLHINSAFDRFDSVRRNFRRFAELGLDIYVTELDVGLAPGTSLQDQANVYAAIVELCLQEPACQSLQTWGFTDRYSWRKSEQPLLLDREYQPKPAYFALQQALVR